MPIQLTQFQDKRKREEIREPSDKFTPRLRKVLKPKSERKRRDSGVGECFPGDDLSVRRYGHGLRLVRCARNVGSERTIVRGHIEKSYAHTAKIREKGTPSRGRSPIAGHGGSFFTYLEKNAYVKEAEC